jgi:diketogulonate reductase-like aldo/keto reductase
MNNMRNLTCAEFLRLAACAGAAREVVRLFFREGGTLIDSSPMYGGAERVTGRLLSELGLHSKPFLATKVWTRGREAGIAQMRESMCLLRAKKIDLMQGHNLSDTATQLRTLREWEDKGLIRYIGISHYGVLAFDEMSEWIKSEPIDFVQFPFLHRRESRRKTAHALLRRQRGGDPGEPAL